MDTIQLYPKYSCPECLPEYKIPDLPRSNLAVRGGKPSPYFDCYGKASLSNQIQPRYPTPEITEINPQAYSTKMAAGYGMVPCKKDGCPDQTWLSQDPRLYDVLRNVYMPLDRPPMSGDVRLRDVYDAKYNNYGQGYTPYDQIKDGDITYYIDNTIQDAFYSPVWAEPAVNEAVLYQDPMGAMKPEYNRKALVNTENPTVTTPVTYPYGLSFIQDTQTHREDLMAYQQRKNNQSKWSARWSASNF